MCHTSLFFSGILYLKINADFLSAFMCKPSFPQKSWEEKKVKKFLIFNVHQIVVRVHTLIVSFFYRSKSSYGAEKKSAGKRERKEVKKVRKKDWAKKRFAAKAYIAIVVATGLLTF